MTIYEPSTDNLPLDREPEFEMVPIESLAPYARKLKKNDHAVDRAVESLKRYGFKGVILARRNGEIIDGELRLKAAKKLGLKRLPAIWCDDLTDEQVRTLRLMIDRSATWAQWDIKELAYEFTELKELGVDLSFTGFDPPEIDNFLFRSKQLYQDCEQSPEAPTEPTTRPGDLWNCGQHRILCGDSTVAADVNRLLGSDRPVVMIADQPYGVEYDPQWRERAGLGTMRQRGAVNNDDRADWTPAFELFTGDVAYVWHGGLRSIECAQSLSTAGFDIRSQIIWAKQHFALSRGTYHWQDEPCWFAVRRGGDARWCGDRTQSTLWEVRNLNPFGGNSAEAPTGHGTQKPVELMKRPILNHTVPGEAVYDPFLGSSTTLVAAELTERICYGLEINPAYVDVSVLRWQKITGRAAILAGDGRTFAEVQIERAKI